MKILYQEEVKQGDVDESFIFAMQLRENNNQ
jgi:hypothetical protein